MITETARPNRLESIKDEDYHRRYARFCVGQGMGHPHQQSFNINNLVYWNFYKGNQWILSEDLGAFLTDESGGARNRVKWVENLIRPMVLQWIGQAIRMQFNAKAVNISPLSKDRKDEALAEMLLNTAIASTLSGDAAQSFRSQHGVGEDEQETAEIFENIYVDKYTKSVNNLLRWVKEHNDFDSAINQLALYQAITGMSVYKGYEMNGEYIWKVQDPDYFFFDRAAKRPDLKDAHYMGDFSYMLPTDIFERWQNISEQSRMNIERYAISNNTSFQSAWNMYGVTQGRCPVIETYWKDSEKYEYGYVMEDGYETLVQIGDKYKDKDLIIPKNENYKKWIGKGKKKAMYCDILRYCIFTPSEITGNEKGKDIIYEYGILPYQEEDCLSPFNISFPYKVQCWNYFAGEVQSPIHDVISPQRILNRGLSASESMLNNSRGAGTAISKNAVDGQGGEDELLRNINQSKPIIVDDRNMGIQNVVGSYGNTLAAISPAMDFVAQARVVIQNCTGVNEAMMGTGGKASDLVGVKEIQVARGSLIQEHFYECLANVMLQTYQSVASVGLRIYADSKRKLSLIVGDEESDVIIISKDLLPEAFRVFIHRASPDAQSKADSITMGTNLFQLGLLGEAQVAELASLGNIDEVGRLMNQFRKEKMFAQMKQAQAAPQQQAEALQAQAAAAQQETDDKNADRALQMNMNQTDNQTKLLTKKMGDQAKKEQIVLKGAVESQSQNIK